jgi:hypothetical protein
LQARIGDFAFALLAVAQALGDFIVGSLQFDKALLKARPCQAFTQLFALLGFAKGKF